MWEFFWFQLRSKTGALGFSPHGEGGGSQKFPETLFHASGPEEEEEEEEEE